MNPILALSFSLSEYRILLVGIPEHSRLGTRLPCKPSSGHPLRQRPAMGSKNQKRSAPMSNIRLKRGLWIVVADGEKALFLKNRGDALFPDLQVVHEMERENPATREQGTDRPGRYSDGVHRSAVEDTDWHRLGKERFADEVAEKLYKLAHSGTFKEIVLIAPPPVLGDMRRKLHKEVTDKITAEIPKTLTNHTIPDIENLLQTA
jgi:protein required for attachment to host cells